MIKIGDTVYVRGQEGYQPGVYFLIKTKVRSITVDPDYLVGKGIAYSLENGRPVIDRNFGMSWWLDREEGLEAIKELNKTYKKKLLNEIEDDLNKLLEKKAYWESVYVDTAYVKDGI